MITNLGRAGWPAIRYRTGDIVTVGTRACSCGRAFLTFPGGMTGRTDDLIVLRGINVFPSAIEAVIRTFDIENGEPVPGNLTASPGRVEENNPALVYLGRWYANTNPAHSGGNASLAMDAGSRVTVNFNGTGINWVAYRDEWSGIARVYVDGVEKSTIDNYLSPAAQRVVYSLGGLPSGSHSLTIEVTGSHNQSAKGSWVWLDAFDVTQ